MLAVPSLDGLCSCELQAFEEAHSVVLRSGSCPLPDTATHKKGDLSIWLVAEGQLRTGLSPEKWSSLKYA